MKPIDPQEWKQDLPAFREKTAAFYKGELKKNDYKGFSGLYGSPEGWKSQYASSPYDGGSRFQRKSMFYRKNDPGIPGEKDAFYHLSVHPAS